MRKFRLVFPSTLVISSFLSWQLVQPAFGAPVKLSARQVIELSNPTVALADINKDGHIDIISASFSSATNTAQVSIQLGTGTGSFTQGPVIELGAELSPSAIATADFNGDGLLDIAVLSANTNGLYILTQGFGGFTITPIELPEYTGSTLNIGIADLNGDRLPDIIVPSSAGPVLFLSSGGGHFQTPVLASSLASTFVAVADLNGDKKADLVLSLNGCCSTNSVGILLGDGHGGFVEPVSQPAFYQVQSRIALADFNRDGKLDIAAVGLYPQANVEILNGNGDGTFGPYSSFTLPATTGEALSIFSADLNADGAADLLVLSTNGSSAASLVGLLNEGKGTFGPANVFPVQANANVAATADFNGDGYPDALVYQSAAGNVASLLFNNQHGAFMDGEVIATAVSPQQIVAADFNDDGNLDLATLINPGGLTIYLNDKNNKSLFTPLPGLPYYGGPLVAGDFNGDRKEDIVVLQNATGETLLGNGDGSFSQLAASFTTGQTVFGAIAADMNGDGKLDIVTSSATINLGNGDGTFRPPFLGDLNYCYGSTAVVVADFNNDGKPDVLTGCGGTLSVFPGNGDGTINYPVFNDYVSGLQSFAVGDFNRDGVPDIAFTSNPNYYSPESTAVTILIGQGNGNFATGVSVPVLTGSSGLIVAGEFDGNGIIDLAVLDDNDSVVSILRGNGNGTFAQPELFGTATSPSCMINGRFRSGSLIREQDLIFCTGQGIGVELNTTTK